MSFEDPGGTTTLGYLKLNHKPSGEVLQLLKLDHASPDHRSFIISTWIKSYRQYARKDGYQELYDVHEPAIAESRWQDCLVATDDDGYTVYGWVCGTPGELYHIYVVPELRRYGMSKAMIEAACGKMPDIARPWPHRTSMRLNPYLLKVK